MLIKTSPSFVFEDSVLLVLVWTECILAFSSSAWLDIVFDPDKPGFLEGMVEKILRIG